MDHLHNVDGPYLGVLAVEMASPASAPTAFHTVLEQILDSVMYAVVFVLALAQQNELDKSVHYLGNLVALFAAIILFYVAHERLKQIVASQNYRKHALGWVISKVFLLAAAFLTGIFTRSISNNFTSGPTKGHFNATTAIIPISVVILLISRLYHGTMVSTHNPYILHAIERPPPRSAPQPVKCSID